MKKFISYISLILCLAAVFSLASCSDDDGVSFIYAAGKIINQTTKARMTPMPVGYEPCGVGQKYGMFRGFPLYTVTGINNEEFAPEDWLTEEYAGRATSFFYGENANFAPFEEMNPTVCYVCEEDVNVISLAEINDAQMLSQLEEILAAEGDVLLPLTDIKSSYSLKFYSPEHPQYYYSVTYSVCESGNYLYDDEDKLCTNVGELLTPYIPAE